MFEELRAMSEGVSQCWWLSRRCVLNWDAWAAIGTVAAVFTALFAPLIQRWFVRGNANALFALAYREDLLSVRIRMNSIAEQYPFHDENVSWAVEAMLEREGVSRARFLLLSRGLDEFSKREIDLTKWPAADLDLAAKVAIAMESVRRFQAGAEVFSNPPADRDWVKMTASVGEALRKAMEDADIAYDAILAASRRLRRKRHIWNRWKRS